MTEADAITDAERIDIIEEWLDDFCYLCLDEPATEYMRGARNVFEEMRLRLAIWKERARC